MKFPSVLKITYIGNEDDLAVITNDSIHNMQSCCDVDIACDLLNVFSEIVWTEEKFHTLVASGKYLGEREEITVTVI